MFRRYLLKLVIKLYGYHGIRRMLIDTEEILRMYESQDRSQFVVRHEVRYWGPEKDAYSGG